MDINITMQIGRLTKDCEIAYTTGGTCVSSFTIAVNRMKDKNGNVPVDFFDVKLFGKQAEALKPYLVKGKQVAVQGALQQERWESNGQKHSRVVINADTVQLIGGTKSGDSGQGTNWNKGQGQSYFGDSVPF